MGYIQDTVKWLFKIDNTNGVTIQDDGSLRQLGSAITFDDIQGNILGSKLSSSAGKVDYDFDDNTIDFSAGGSLTTEADRIGWNVQVPHAMVVGADAYFETHFHWIQEDTVERTLSYRYRVLNNGQPIGAWVTGTVTTNTTNNVFPYTSGSITQITENGFIDATGFNVSTILQWQMARTDGNSGILKVAYMDHHIKIDSNGSMEEYYKDGAI